MSLITRFSKLLTADAHAVLDKVEDPLALLKQSLRDMHESLIWQQNQLEAYQQHQQKLTDAMAQYLQTFSQIEQDLDLCFSTDNPTLARNLVKRKLLLKRRQQDAEHSLVTLNKNIGLLTTQLQENQAEYDATCLQAESLQSQVDCANSKSDFNTVFASSSFSSVSAISSPYSENISEADIDLAILKEQQARQRQ